MALFYRDGFSYMPTKEVILPDFFFLKAVLQELAESEKMAELRENLNIYKEESSATR